MSQQTQLVKKPLVCRWCQKVEITFSKAKVSPNGKMIPLNIHSLEPHKCSSNPYYHNVSNRETSFMESGRENPPKQITLQQVEYQATNTLLHEILFEINEVKISIVELQMKK